MILKFDVEGLDGLELTELKNQLEVLKRVFFIPTIRRQHKMEPHWF